MLMVDCRGQACPQPVINTRRVVEVNPEETVAVVVDNPTARDNLLILAEGLGRKAEWKEDESGFRVVIHPAAPGVESAKERSAQAPIAAGPFVVVLASDRLGQGDEVLGGILMKSFLTSLLEVEPPASLIFLNRGVFLAASGSQVLDLLEKLAGRGTELLACGTCLDYYNLKNDLRVGQVSNMFTILQRMTGAGRLIQW